MALTERLLHRELALWIIRLNCDDPLARAQAQQEFKRWQQQYPEHIEYLNDLQIFNEEMQHLPQQHAIDAKTMHKTLSELRQQQNHILKKIGKLSLAFIGFCYLGYLAFSCLPFDYALADYKTQVAESKQLVLEDGTKITLAAKSAINVHFSDQQRHIELVQGELYVDVAKDPSRPLLISTLQADVRALGTQFILSRYRNNTKLSMLESKSQVISKLNVQIPQQIINSGNSVQIDQSGISPLKTNSKLLKKTWGQQQILAEDTPLSDVLYRLNAYHQGYIIFNEQQLKHIKVTGVINPRQSLDQTLNLFKIQYPELEFISLGKWFTYARLKNV